MLGGLGLLLGANTAAASAEVVVLAPAQERISLAGHIEELRDESGQWTLDEVRAPAQSAQFVPTTTDTPSHGFTSAAYWYRLRLQDSAGRAGEASDWVLELNYGTLDYIDLYVSQQNRTTLIQTGDRRPPSPDLLPHRSFALPLKIQSGETVELYLRVLQGGSHVVPLALWSSRGFHTRTVKDNLWNGAFGGAVALMVLYNLIIFWVIRDRAYLYYVMYVASTGALMLVLSGYARLFGNGLFDAAPWLINEAAPMVMYLVPLFGTLFFRQFLQTAQHVSRVHRLTHALVALLVGLLLLQPLLPYAVGVRLSSALSAVCAMLGLAVGAYLALRGLRAARLYLLAWSALLIAILVVVLRNYGVLPSHFDSWFIMQFGVCLEATILSLALADRINAERRERERMERLKHYFSPQVAETILAEGGAALLAPRRRDVTVTFIDIRGFTAFAAQSDPEAVMAVLREFHEAVVAEAERHQGTLDHFAGDGVMAYFNAPIEVKEHELRAVRMAFDLRKRFETLSHNWRQRGYDLGVGMGMANGYATVGAVGARGRLDYSCSGSVVNLAARLCAKARHGQILVPQELVSRVAAAVVAEPLGEQELKGIPKPVPVYNLERAAMP